MSLLLLLLRLSAREIEEEEIAWYAIGASITRMIVGRLRIFFVIAVIVIVLFFCIRERLHVCERVYA